MMEYDGGHVDFQYIKLLSDCLHGVEKTDRTGTGTFSQFGRQLRFDLSMGFPILTTKKVHWKSVVEELLWFLSGSTDVSVLEAKGVKIWSEWKKPDGTIGPGYGKQFRRWSRTPTIDNRNFYVDQIANLVHVLKENPDSRRHIVSAWNVADIPDMALPPCHCFFQCYVSPPTQFHYNGLCKPGVPCRTEYCGPDGCQGKQHSKPRLSLQMYQRSADVFLGVPFNIASYALLTHMLAHVCGYDVGEYVHTFGDVHLYKNHVKQAVEQLGRKPKALPKLVINPEKTDIFSFTVDDLKLEGYDPDPAIPAPVAV